MSISKVPIDCDMYKKRHISGMRLDRISGVGSIALVDLSDINGGVTTLVERVHDPIDRIGSYALKVSM